MTWNFAEIFEAKEFAYSAVLTALFIFVLFLIGHRIDLISWTPVYLLGTAHIGGFIIRNLLNM